MADLIFPPSLVPKRVEWTLERNVAAFESPLTYTAQRVSRASARWRASIEMPRLDASETAMLSAWLDQVSKAENCGLVPVFQNYMLGTETAGFVSGQAPFSAANIAAEWNGQRGFTNGLLLPPYFQSGDLVVYSGNSTANQTVSAFSATSGLPYAVILDVPIQTNPPAWYVANAGVSTIQFSAPDVVGRSIAALFAPAGGQLVVGLRPGNGATPFTQSRYSSLTVNRILIAQGTAAAGSSTVQVYAGNSNAPGLAMRKGQFCQIATSRGYELKRLSVDVDLIGGVVLNGVTVNHLGRAVFEPALRGSVAASAAILTHQPVCRMRLAQAQSSSTIDAPMFGGFAFEMLEEIER